MKVAYAKNDVWLVRQLGDCLRPAVIKDVSGSSIRVSINGGYSNWYEATDFHKIAFEKIGVRKRKMWFWWKVQRV